MKRLFSLVLFIVSAAGMTIAQPAPTVNVSFSPSSPTAPWVVPVSGIHDITFSVFLTKTDNYLFSGRIKIYAETKQSGITPTTQTVFTSDPINYDDSGWVNDTQYLFNGTFSLSQGAIVYGPAKVYASFEAGSTMYKSQEYSADIPSLDAQSITASPTNFTGSGIPVITGSAPTGAAGPGSYVYKWESSTACSPSSGFSVISGATNQNYTPSAPITVTTHYRRTVTSHSKSNVSNTVTVSIGPTNTIYGVAPLFFSANGGTPNQLVGSSPSGGSGTPTYQWQSSTTTPNDAGFSNIAGATGISINNPQPITQTTYYRRIVTLTSGSCQISTASNVVAYSVIKNNTIQFLNPPNDAELMASPAQPQPIHGEIPNGLPAGATPTYRWFEGLTLGSLHVVFGSGPEYSPGQTPETRYYIRELTVNIGGTQAYSENSNSLHVTVYPAIENNIICCSGQSVYGNDYPAQIGGEPATNGYAPLHYQWWMSTDNQNSWVPAAGTPVDNGLNFLPANGLSGDVYFKRYVFDDVEFTDTAGLAGIEGDTDISNAVLISYHPVLPSGATILNPIYTDGPFGHDTLYPGYDCLEVLRTQDAAATGFSNQTGYPGNEVYFRIYGAVTVIMNACWSSVDVKAYLYDASFNPITPTSSGGDCLVGLNLGFSDRVIYAMVEGKTTNGTINAQFYSANQGDCVDSYQGFYWLNPGYGEGEGLQSMVYPNPAEGTTNLKFTESAKKETRKVFIYNKYNQLVKSFETTASEVNVSVDDLSPDVYYVKVEGEKKSETHRLIVK